MLRAFPIQKKTLAEFGISIFAMKPQRMLLAFITALVVSGASSLRLAPNGEPWNFLFLVVDDLRPELGVYGRSHMHTPNLDALFNKGVRFENFYVTQAYCAPSRNSFMSGAMPDRIQDWNFFTSFRDAPGGANWTAMPQFFKERGYWTGGAGKVYHPGLPPNEDVGKSWSIPKWEDEDFGCKDTINCVKPMSELEGTGDFFNVDKSISYLQGLEKGEYPTPFFLALGLHKPHLSMITVPEFHALYPPNDTSKVPPVTNPHWPSKSPFVARHSCIAANYSNWGHWIDPLHFDIDTPAPMNETQGARAGYFASVSMTDYNMGRMLSALNNSKFINSTVVVFVADHGWELGERSQWCKMMNSEVGTRVPFGVYVPGSGYAHGGVTHGLGSTVDIYRTLADIAGMADEVPAEVDGVSLRPLLLDPATSEAPRAASFSVFPRSYETNPATPNAFASCPFAPAPGSTYAQQIFGFCVDSHFTNASEFSYMGYAVRNNDWRMVRWYEWNGTTLEPCWNRVNATELYNYQGVNMADFCAFDNDNVEEEHHDVVVDMENLLKEQWTKWTGKTPKSC